MSPIMLQEKPRADKRSYQYSVLPNGMHVLNVQDALSHQTSMAVAVRAGSFDDPVELPGLAHFCEHMLFLGTKKYPEPSGFDSFLSSFGGSSNAYTADEVTVYFASASGHAAKEGLDRFADFFRAPLFDNRYVEKEVHAINSEHEKNIQDNGRRIFELMLSQANPESAVSRFKTGNVETLYTLPQSKNISTVGALRKYFKQRYCPQMMRLVTFGADTAAEQLRLVKLAGFGDIPPGGKECAEDPRSFAEPKPWPASRMGQKLLVQGTEAAAQLWLHFQLPNLSRKYASQPASYLDYVLTYRGEDSLYTTLSDSLGLITGLSTSVDVSSAGTGYFVMLTLTDLGYNHSETVLDTVFSYIASVRHAGIDSKLYQSLADMYKLQWDWSEPADPSSTASNLAEVMTRLPKDDILTGDTLIRKPDPSLVLELLGLLKPDNMNMALVASSRLSQKPLQESGLPVRTLPYYDVKYVKKPLKKALRGAQGRWMSWLEGGQLDNDELRAELQQRLEAEGILSPKLQTSKVQPVVLVADAGLTLPPKAPKAIEGIPKDVSLKNMHIDKGTNPKSVAEVDGSGSANSQGSIGVNGATVSMADQLFGPLPGPLKFDSKVKIALLSEASTKSEESDVWFRAGWMTESPKVSYTVLLRPFQTTAELDGTPLKTMRLALYRRLLSEEITPKLVDLTAAGSSYSVSAGPGGIALNLVGYQEAMPHLLESVLKAFNSFNAKTNSTSPARFERAMRSMRQDLETYSSMPVAYAKGDLATLLQLGEFSRPECLKAMDNLTGDAGLKLAGSAASELLLSTPLHPTALVMGNLEGAEAQQTMQSLVAGIPLPSSAKTSRSIGDGAIVQRVKPVVKPSKPVEVRAINPRAGDPNDVASVTLLHDVADVESRATLSILSQILYTAAFDELRTQRQLGYVVDAHAGAISNVMYVSASVQGTKLKADEAEAAIEGLFTSIIPQKLANMSQKELEEHVNAFQQQLLEPPMGASQEFSHFWVHVSEGGCMHLLDRVVAFIKSGRLTRQRLIQTWDQLISGSHGQVDGKSGVSLRQKISVKYFSAGASSGRTSSPQAAPPRPTLEEVKAFWKKQKVSPGSMELLAREWTDTKVFDRADSEARNQLVKEGGFFPTELRCSDVPGNIQAPQHAPNLMSSQSFLQVPNSHRLMRSH
eukprot:TRINITY_DN66088_c0_g1_i1.p1 TRINITY_DN66088_c0_g1~~TRINITY_DN66088_c0_g1_i1.p1  ORF type:complete len:1257 (-),score=245.39 TRINITY_DN66088_c0_g1_i1:352-3846(-)